MHNDQCLCFLLSLVNDTLAHEILYQCCQSHMFKNHDSGLIKSCEWLKNHEIFKSKTVLPYLPSDPSECTHYFLCNYGGLGVLIFQKKWKLRLIQNILNPGTWTLRKTPNNERFMTKLWKYAILAYVYFSLYIYPLCNFTFWTKLKT